MPAHRFSGAEEAGEGFQSANCQLKIKIKLTIEEAPCILWNMTEMPERHTQRGAVRYGTGTGEEKRRAEVDGPETDVDGIVHGGAVWYDMILEF